MSKSPYCGAGTQCHMSKTKAPTEVGANHGSRLSSEKSGESKNSVMLMPNP